MPPPMTTNMELRLVRWASMNSTTDRAPSTLLNSSVASTSIEGAAASAGAPGRRGAGKMSLVRYSVGKDDGVDWRHDHVIDRRGQGPGRGEANSTSYGRGVDLIAMTSP